VISQKNGIFNLSTRNTTYLFALRESGHLEHLYYVSHIKERSIELQALNSKALFPMGTSTLYSESTKNLNFNILKQEISTPGKGDFRNPSTVISYNGGMTTLDFLYVRHQIAKGKITTKSLPSSYANGEECETLQITLKDKELPIRIILSYSVFEDSDVITRKTTVYNESDGRNAKGGGKKTFSNSIELSFPLVPKAKMRLVTFVDWGFIGDDSIDEISRGGYGLGLEWFSPVGPIQLMFANPLNKQEGDRTSNFEFTMGQRF